MTFANPILPDTRSEDAPYRKFKTPEELGYTVPCGLLLCGHFDGHDVYRYVGSEDFVLVYGNANEAVFCSTLLKANRWLAENDMDQWASMRAILKGRAALVMQIEELLAKLKRLKRKHQDDDSFGVFVCDTVCDAIELIEDFKEAAGL